MNKKILFSIVSLLAITLTSCKKDYQSPIAPLPTANFTVTGFISNNVITMATYDQYAITNNSSNGSSYLWDFGDDSISTSENPVLSYPESGNYVITLTVKNKDGKTATITKNVKVLDRVAKQVVITNLFTTSPIAQSFNHSNVWAQIRYAANDSTYLMPSNSSISSFEAPVIFKSPVLLNFDSSKSIPYTFTIPDKIILDYPAIMLSNVKHTGNKWQHIGYGLELYAQNASGTYLLTSSYYPLYEAQSGGLRVDKADIQNNVFSISYGDIKIIGDYE